MNMIILHRNIILLQMDDTSSYNYHVKSSAGMPSCDVLIHEAARHIATPN